jgi:hypothetical protein
MSPSLVPSSDQDHDLHFVLCDFGKYGKTYIETNPNEADRATIVRNMIDGQYARPLARDRPETHRGLVAGCVGGDRKIRFDGGRSR